MTELSTDNNKAARFFNIGERTNVTGSARFKKLILSGDYATAVEVARQQVENGAQIIDVNMDEGLLDAKEAMVTFLRLLWLNRILPVCRSWSTVPVGKSSKPACNAFPANPSSIQSA